MSRYGEHIRVETQDAVTSMTFAPARNPMLVLFGIVALCVASPLIATVRSDEDFASDPKPVVALFLLLATSILGLVLFNVLWTLFGFWHTAIDAETLTVTKRIGALERRWSYPLVDVLALGINERRTRGGFLRRIAFVYRGKLCYATPSLSRYEARVLIEGPFVALIR